MKNICFIIVVRFKTLKYEAKIKKKPANV